MIGGVANVAFDLSCGGTGTFSYSKTERCEFRISVPFGWHSNPRKLLTLHCNRHNKVVTLEWSVDDNVVNYDSRPIDKEGPESPEKAKGW